MTRQWTRSANAIAPARCTPVRRFARTAPSPICRSSSPRLDPSRPRCRTCSQRPRWRRAERKSSVSAESEGPRRRRWLSLLQCRRGTAAVEFALVCPALFIFLLGIYSVGSVMHCISSVRYALEETARMLQLNPTLTEEDLQDAIDTKL